MSRDPRRDLHAYRVARAALKRKTQRFNLPCWLCGQPFDWSLHPSHGDAWTADHVVPLAQGGHITGTLKPAHRRCNSKRNDGRAEARIPTTRRW